MDYATTLKRMNAGEFCQELEHTLLCASDPDCCSLVDLLILKDHARINGHETAVQALQQIITDINRREKQDAANRLVLNNSKSLRIRLLRARSCLTREFREHFQEYALDEKNHRLLSDGGEGSLALQWTNDGETTTGSVSLVDLSKLAMRRMHRPRPLARQS